MKKVLMFLLVVFLSTGIATSQSGYRELSVSYGMRSYHEQPYFGGYPDLLALVFRQRLVSVSYENCKNTGPALLSFKLIPESRVGFGLTAGYIYGSFDQITTFLWVPSAVSKVEYSALTIAPEIDFRYIRREKFTMYSNAALGIVFLSEKRNNPTEHEKVKMPDIHFSLLGFRIGNEFGAFAELGFGFKGIVNFGVNMRI